MYPILIVKGCGFMNYYEKIKEELIDNELTKKAKDYSKNKSDLKHYYNVGKIIVEAQGGEERAKYGDGLIKEYSKKLMIDLNEKCSERNLRNMRQFYVTFKDEKWNAVRTNLSWTHYRELLVLNNINEISYYIDISIRQNLGYRELHERIKNKEYQRLDDTTKNKLIKKEETNVIDFVKNPIVIRNSLNKEITEEKYLKKLIFEDLEFFLSELGTGYTFVGREYKIKIGERYYFIDMLLFNVKYNCYIVLEFKITELKARDYGQIEMYMNYVNKVVKSSLHENTIGIIICKKDNKLLLEYCSDPRIFSTTYEICFYNIN